MGNETATFGIDKTNICTRSILDSTGDHKDTVDIMDYRNWFHGQPQWLIWTNVYFNLGRTEGLCHNITCSICQNYITGFRYRSMKSFNYNICQNCFLVGKDQTKSYKDFYPLIEYTTVEQREGIDVLSKVFRTKLQTKRSLFRKAEKKLGYLPLAAGSSSQKSAHGPIKTDNHPTQQITFSRSEQQEIMSTLRQEQRIISRETSHSEHAKHAGMVVSEEMKYLEESARVKHT